MPYVPATLITRAPLSLPASTFTLLTSHFTLPSELAMILLTRMNGQAFVVNAEKIRYVESTPDTVVCCDTGDRMMVRESLNDVVQKAIEYARVIRRAVTE